MGPMKNQPWLKNLVGTMELLAFQVWEIPYTLNWKKAGKEALLGVDSMQQLIMVHTTIYIYTYALFLISSF